MKLLSYFLTLWDGKEKIVGRYRDGSHKRKREERNGKWSKNRIDQISEGMRKHQRINRDIRRYFWNPKNIQCIQISSWFTTSASRHQLYTISFSAILVWKQTISLYIHRSIRNQSTSIRYSNFHSSSQNWSSPPRKPHPHNINYSSRKFHSRFSLPVAV